MNKMCSIVNCEGKHRSKSYCNKHYIRFMKYGDVLYIKSRMEYVNSLVNNSRTCTMENCEEKYYAKGYCGIHYRKWFKEKYPEKLLVAKIKYIKKGSDVFDMTTAVYGHASVDWGNIIKKRDEKCKICESKENLIAHHILYRHKYPEKSLDVDNGITLCTLCHYDYHDLNGWRQ